MFQSQRHTSKIPIAEPHSPHNPPLLTPNLLEPSLMGIHKKPARQRVKPACWPIAKTRSRTDPETFAVKNVQFSIHRT